MCDGCTETGRYMAADPQVMPGPDFTFYHNGTGIGKTSGNNDAGAIENSGVS
jgi:hypothetical protein